MLLFVMLCPKHKISDRLAAAESTATTLVCLMVNTAAAAAKATLRTHADSVGPATTTTKATHMVGTTTTTEASISSRGASTTATDPARP